MHDCRSAYSDGDEGQKSPRSDCPWVRIFAAKAKLLRQLVSRKKVAQLEARRVLRVRAVDGIVLYILRPLFADSSWLGLRGIGGAHQFTQAKPGTIRKKWAENIEHN